MNILGIDLGSYDMAFAIFRDDKYIKSWSVKIGYSDQELKKNKELKQINMYSATFDAVKEAVILWQKECDIHKENDLCAFEHIPIRFATVRPLIEVAGIVKAILSRYDILYDEISPTVIKKQLLDSGKSPDDKKDKKQLMVDCINKKFGLEIKDHNIADAIAIGFTAWVLEQNDNKTNKL